MEGQGRGILGREMEGQGDISERNEMIGESLGKKWKGRVKFIPQMEGQEDILVKEINGWAGKEMEGHRRLQKKQGEEMKVLCECLQKVEDKGRIRNGRIWGKL